MENKNNDVSTYRVSILMDAHVNNLFARLYQSPHKKELDFKLNSRIKTSSDLFNIALIIGFKQILKELGIDENDL